MSCRYSSHDFHCRYSPPDTHPFGKLVLLPESFSGRAIAEAFVRVGTFSETDPKGLHKNAEERRWIGTLREYHVGYRIGMTGELEYVTTVDAFTGRHDKSLHEKSGWYFNGSWNTAFVLQRLRADAQYTEIRITASCVRYEDDWRNREVWGYHDFEHNYFEKMLKDMVKDLLNLKES